jgi:hypothetical protein
VVLHSVVGVLILLFLCAAGVAGLVIFSLFLVIQHYCLLLCSRAREGVAGGWRVLGLWCMQQRGGGQQNRCGDTTLQSTQVDLDYSCCTLYS